MKTIDTRPRCEFCNKVPRGKAALAGYQRYAPYCSFDHQERGRLASVMRSLPRGVALPDQALRDTAAEIDRTAAAFIAGGVKGPEHG